MLHPLMSTACGRFRSGAILSRAAAFGGLALAVCLGATEAADAVAPASLKALVDVLLMVDDADFQLDVLKGMHSSLNGRHDVAMPEGWPALSAKLHGSPNAAVRKIVLELSLIFHDPQAMAALRKIASDESALPRDRSGAIAALAQARDAELVPVLHRLLTHAELRGAALRALAALADPAAPQLIVQHYARFSDDDKREAIATLASRVAYARALLAALERGDIPHRDVSAFAVRQLQSLNDREITEKLNAVWGAVRPTSQGKAAKIADYKRRLTPAALKNADRAQGRLVFVRSCASCHVLFGEGNKVGPELTGAQRNNLDYLLENLVDPNAVVGRDFRVTVLETTGGRVLNGIVQAENENTLTLRTPTDQVLVAKQEIAERTLSPVSMMPEGALDALRPEEVLNLVAYLAGADQAPLPPLNGGPEKPPSAN